MRFIDLTGIRYGRLTVAELDKSNTNKKSTRWICRCDCGTIKSISAANLKNGHNKSCGCLRQDVKRTHNGYGTRLHDIWRGMKSRCSSHHDYSGRGITVCDEWQTFEPFRDWAMQTGYQDNLEIDRINNDDGYNPSNCRWADRSLQCYNRRISNSNTSGHTGVCRRGKNKNIFFAYITRDKRQISLGNFSNFEDACAARRKAELELYGYFSPTSQ